MCQEVGSTISIHRLNYSPAAVAEATLMWSNYNCRNVCSQTAANFENTLLSGLVQAIYGESRRLCLAAIQEHQLTEAVHLVYDTVTDGRR